MSNVTRYNVNYALNQPLNLEQPLPIIAKRAPGTADKFPIGQLWIFTTNNAVYVLTSIVNNLAQWQGVTGAAASFASLTVNPGPVSLVSSGSGNIVIGNAANANPFIMAVGPGNFALVGGGNVINIGADAAANSINIGSLTGAGETTISAGSGGILLLAGGNISMGAAASGPVASPTAAVTNNARVGQATFTGFTTAAAASQIFTITNAVVIATSPLFVTATNVGSNVANMTVSRVNPGAGSFAVTLTNTGAAALNGNITITWWILN